ncbi:MAG: hypothetical protein QXK63_05035, partial [Thermoproteus sp.]
MFRREDAKKIEDAIARIDSALSSINTSLNELRGAVPPDLRSNLIELRKSIDGLSNVISRSVKDLVDGV